MGGMLIGGISPIAFSGSATSRRGRLARTPPECPPFDAVLVGRPADQHPEIDRAAVLAAAAWNSLGM